MDKDYWINRRRVARTMAGAADGSEARLGCYELDGRHSIGAAHCPPLPVVAKPPAVDGQRATLHLPRFANVRPGSIFGGLVPAEADGIAVPPLERR